MLTDNEKKELLADALRKHPNWADAYLAAKEALEWYGEQAEAIARHMDEKKDLVVMACVTALALDKGDRAKNV